MMPRLRKSDKRGRLIEPKLERPLPTAQHKRLGALEKLVAAIEDELSDDELTDEQKLQNIGERVAQLMDGR